MQAYQYKKRLEKQENAKFPFWKDYELDISVSTIEPIEFKDAKRIIEEYEYLGGLSAMNQYMFGLYFPHKTNGNKLLSGAIVFSNDYAQNTGVWDRFIGETLLLNRGACAFWCPKGSNSHFIMSAIKQLPEKYRVITATVDEDAGEIGTIYQACNFYYVGVMRKNKQRISVIIDGKKYSSLSARKKFGTIGMAKLKAMFPDCEFVFGKSKARYFYFRGSKREKKYNLKQITTMEYPKRYVNDNI